MTDLYNKYSIYKIDQSDGSEQPTDGEFFVLKICSDEHARSAALCYADHVEHEDIHLSHQIRKRVKDCANEDSK